MGDDESQRHGDITGRLVEETAPVWIYLVEHLEMDEATNRLLRAAMLKTAFAGARVGAHEAVAQLLEQGFDPAFDIGLRDPSWDELLEEDED